MNALSITIGIVALILAIIAFFPLIGILNWLVLPIAVIGLVFGLLAEKTSGRNINIVVIVLALFRLFLGGGIL